MDDRRARVHVPHPQAGRPTAASSHAGGRPRVRRLRSAANPQYVNDGAYTTLAHAVYPLSLPFDLAAEEARTYLDHLGVTRSTIMETLASGERADVLESAALAREHLGLTTAQADIITGVTTGQPGAAQSGPWNLWGFPAQTLSAANSIPAPFDAELD